MKYKTITTILISILITSCQTASYNSKNVNWPQLSPIHWRSITVEELKNFEDGDLDLFLENENKETALFFASQYSRNLDVIEYLINLGLDVNHQSVDGNTPLIVAPLNSNTEVIPLLLKSGEGVHTLNNFGVDSLGISFLYSENSKNIVALLKKYEEVTPGLKKSITPYMNTILEGKVDLQNISHQRSLNGYTPEMFAVHYSNDLNVQKRLIINSKKIDARDAKRWSVGTLAAVYTEFPEIIDLLVSRSAKLNPNTPNNISAFMLACAVNKNVNVLKKLIENGANINEQSIDGFTPLMFACLGNDNHEVVTLLLNNGADPKIINSYGESALDLILKNQILVGSNGYWELNDSIANNP